MSEVTLVRTTETYLRVHRAIQQNHSSLCTCVKTEDTPALAQKCDSCKLLEDVKKVLHNVVKDNQAVVKQGRFFSWGATVRGHP